MARARKPEGKMFEIYRGKNDQWYWRLWASNGRVLATSSEGFNNKQRCINNAKAIRDGLASLLPTDWDWARATGDG